jgi:hypothetical protein
VINNFVKGLEGLKKRRESNTFEMIQFQNGKESDSIPDEILRDVYLKAMNRISDVYVEGTIRYIEEHHSELDEKISQADMRVNEIWKACNEGEASIEDFKFVLASHEALYKQAINLNKRNNL